MGNIQHAFSNINISLYSNLITARQVTSAGLI